MLFIRAPIEKLLKEQTKTGEPLELSSQEQINIQDPVVEEALTKLTSGILIITEHRQVLYANECACRILRQINRDRQTSEAIPQEISYFCKSIAEVRRQFPEQHWVMETQIFISSSVNFKVSGRYMKLESLGKNCIVLKMKDHFQLVEGLAMEEAKQYSLTERETEIWLLQRANYTYKQIASELFIAPNTVKKHMQNIHLKQKAKFQD